MAYAYSCACVARASLHVTVVRKREYKYYAKDARKQERHKQSTSRLLLLCMMRVLVSYFTNLCKTFLTT